jgi:hypothetical protein
MKYQGNKARIVSESFPILLMIVQSVKTVLPHFGVVQSLFFITTLLSRLFITAVACLYVPTRSL